MEDSQNEHTTINKKDKGFFHSCIADPLFWGYMVFYTGVLILLFLYGNMLSETVPIMRDIVSTQEQQLNLLQQMLNP